jgi:hypothetical protein
VDGGHARAKGHRRLGALQVGHGDLEGLNRRAAIARIDITLARAGEDGLDVVHTVVGVGH